MSYFELMKSACSDVNLEFDKEKYDKFTSYKELIKEWNQKVNLTAITEDEQIFKKHFIDSIKIFNFIPLKEAKNIIDVGTGGGFPGIPIKIISPQTNVVLLDSLNKRVNFLNEVINKLELKEINAIHGRAEDFGQDKLHRENYDAVVSRAVANLAVLSEFCLPYVKLGGFFIAMKGPSVEEEIGEAKNTIKILGGEIEEIIEVKIEDSDLKHNLVIIKKIKNTPKIYPRKAGTAAKKPLK